MYSAYKLNKQGGNIQPWCTHFPIWNQSIVPCLILAVASWPAYSFLRRPVRWSGIPISWRIFQFFCDPHSQRLSVVNKAEVDVFLELFCIFHDLLDVRNVISCPFTFSKSSWIIWKFTIHITLKPGLENFEHYFASIWGECNCVVVWTFFGIAFLWDWNEKWPLLVLWPLLCFPNLLVYWVQHFNSIIYSVWNSSAAVPSPLLGFFIVMLPKAPLMLNSKISVSRWVIILSWLSGSCRSF